MWNPIKILLCVAPKGQNHYSFGIAMARKRPILAIILAPKAERVDIFPAKMMMHVRFCAFISPAGWIVD